MVRQDEEFDLRRGNSNAGSCVFNKQIYGFNKEKYEEVHRYSLESGNAASSTLLSKILNKPDLFS